MAEELGLGDLYSRDFGDDDDDADGDFEAGSEDEDDDVDFEACGDDEDDGNAGSSSTSKEQTVGAHHKDMPVLCPPKEVFIGLYYFTSNPRGLFL